VCCDDVNSSLSKRVLPSNKMYLNTGNVHIFYTTSNNIYVCRRVTYDWAKVLEGLTDSSIVSVQVCKTHATATDCSQYLSTHQTAGIHTHAESTAATAPLNM
jgi:uncharacterized protein YbcV (DUF1398 family)